MLCDHWNLDMKAWLPISRIHSTYTQYVIHPYSRKKVGNNLLNIIIIIFSGKRQFNKMKAIKNCTTRRCCHQKLCHIYFDWQHLWWIHRLYIYCDSKGFRWRFGHQWLTRLNHQVKYQGDENYCHVVLIK